jgi:hypothetical protein
LERKKGQKDALDSFPFLKNYLGPDEVLVPAPRSSPIKAGALWPALRICEALVAAGQMKMANSRGPESLQDLAAQTGAMPVSVE